MKSSSLTIQVKLYCCTVYYAVKVVLTFESVDVLKCDNSDERAVLSCRTVYHAKSNF